jgi:hypothetical protein
MVENWKAGLEIQPFHPMGISPRSFGASEIAGPGIKDRSDFVVFFKKTARTVLGSLHEGPRYRDEWLTAF